MDSKCTFCLQKYVHSTTGISPFEILYGRKPRLPIDLPIPVLEGEEIQKEKYINVVRETLEKLHRKLIRILQKLNFK